jgi:hypothetical protein
METIYTFLENLFKGLPQTKQLKKAKDDLYQMMIEKYLDYKEDGKTENESVGLVISEFGNIDEILESFNIELDPAKISLRIISETEAESFMETKRNNSTRISIGVFLCIAAVGLLAALNRLLPMMLPNLSEFQTDLIAISLFLIMVSTAVALFIYSGLELSSKAKIFFKPFDLSQAAEKLISDKHQDFIKSYHQGIILGVLLIMLSIIPFILSQVSNAVGLYFILTGFVLIGMGVFILVKIGIINGGYSQLLKLGDYQPTRREKQKVVDFVASIVFPLTAVVYLAWSFLGNAWTISWILWPIVGICFGIFASIVDYLHRDQTL